MTTGYVKVKEWVIDKIQNTAERYNTYIDIYSRDENGMVSSENGYVVVKVIEVLKESEKAVEVVLSTGDVVGSYKGWKAWIPKSAIA